MPESRAYTNQVLILTNGMHGCRNLYVVAVILAPPRETRNALLTNAQTATEAAESRAIGTRDWPGTSLIGNGPRRRRGALCGLLIFAAAQ